MNAEGFAINQIIIMAQFEMRQAIAQLQVEEKGREVASLQGRVSGYKELIANIAKNFHLTERDLEDEGDEPYKVPDLTDDDLAMVNEDVNALLAREEWKNVIERVESNIYSVQGKYQGQKIYESFFNAVNDEVARRAAQAAEKAKQPSLFRAGRFCSSRAPPLPDPLRRLLEAGVNCE